MIAWIVLAAVAAIVVVLLVDRRPVVRVEDFIASSELTLSVAHCLRQLDATNKFE